jgi:hypothetical protein
VAGYVGGCEFAGNCCQSLSSLFLFKQKLAYRIYDLLSPAIRHGNIYAH